MTTEINLNKIPSYISKDFFKKALENSLSEKNIQIENYAVCSVGGGGENYTSDIYPVSIEYKNCEDDETKKTCLIIKHIQTGGEERKVLNTINVFNIERNMYSEIVPKIEDLLGDNIKMAPKCYYTSESERVLVLSDLRALGYKLGDRLTGLDEAHCAVLLQKIGQFHAASMVIAKRNPESVQRFQNGMISEYSRESKTFKAIFIANFEHMISIIETWPDYEVIAHKLKKISSNYLDIFIDTVKPREGELKVLNHGDLWVNNIMFKYDNNNTPCDVAFIDLQLSVYKSLGIDINYFLNISAQLDVLKMKRYELLKIYYHSLKSTLEKLNYSPIPKWDDIRKEIRAKELYGLFAFSGILPLISMDRNASQDNSLEKLRDADVAKAKRNIMFSSKRIIETIKYALNRLDELGVLDL